MNYSDKEHLVLLILAAAGDVRVPARCWPLEVALETLARLASPDMQPSITTWPIRTDGTGRTFVGVDATLRRLLNDNALIAEGHDWEAGFRVVASTARVYERELLSLSHLDRRAIEVSAHKLVACLKTWSKNAVASRPAIASTF